MQSRKFIILLIFLLFILTISSVDAKDLNTTDSVMLSRDSNQTEILDSSYVNQSIFSSDATNASEAFSSSYSLQNDKAEGVYGIVDFGTNVLTLNIYDVNNNEITILPNFSKENNLNIYHNYTFGMPSWYSLSPWAIKRFSFI